MSSTGTSAADRNLLAAARRGDPDAYSMLVERHRRELHVHCYRMLASVHDAEDALQDALLRAWRGLPRFDGRSSLRAWLYRIATNTCLDLIARRPKRVLPIDIGPATDPHDMGGPLTETVWIEPYPDEQLGVDDGPAAPAARYERRESVELAFIAALQHLPANQRAVLILREVLGFSAQEVADDLGTTVASVNSALQRARRTLDERLPQESQQATLRTLGDARVRELVERYVDAMERGDVEAVIAMLSEDAAWSMPPLQSWFTGTDRLRTFLTRGPLSGTWRWKHRITRANGQPAVGGYVFNDAAGAYRPFALDVLTLRGDRIQQVTAFIINTTEVDEFDTWPDAEHAPRRLDAVFRAFGLPDRLA